MTNPWNEPNPRFCQSCGKPYKVCSQLSLHDLKCCNACDHGPADADQQEGGDT